LVPIRHWWAYILAAVCGHLLAAYQAHWPLSFALYSEVFDAVQNISTAAGIRILIKSPQKFATLRDVIVFVLIAVIIVPFATAFWGAALTLSYHYGTSYWVEWRKLGISNGVTMIVLVPAILEGFRHLSAGRIAAMRGRLLEAGLLGVSILTVGAFVFNTLPAGPDNSPVLLYAPIPLLVWAALRFGLGGVNASMLIITFLAIWGAMRGRGPFLMETPADNALSLQLFLLATATPLMFLAVVIEEERRSHYELRESDARMALAANAAKLDVWEWDMVKDKIWSTEKKGTHQGFVKSGLMDFNDFLESLHPDDREPVSHAMAKSMNREGEYESEYRVVLPDEPARWVAARGRVEFNAAGKPVFMRGISLDITRRKEAEESLRESENRFRIMADHAPVLIWMSGTDKLCNFFNKSWLGFTGRTLEQELGDGWTEGVHREDINHCIEVYDNAFNAREEFMMEYRLRRHDGEYRWVLDTGLPRIAPDGTFLGYIGSCLDMTERKQSELEITQQRNELAHLSRVTMLGELSGSLAHELNQPLTAILSNAQAAQRFLALGNADLNEVRAILKDIVDEDKRAGEIIRRLRLLLKKGEVQRQPSDANEVVQEVLKLVRSDLVNHGVVARAELAHGLPAVIADRVQIQQVLLNLVMNACDAMAGHPARDRKLVVRTGFVDSDGVRVSIVDHGAGIAPDQLEKIFEPFFTTKPHGMGMGLSVCRTIITAHGGKLWAVNNPERGATFHVTLPAVKGNEGGDL
jgi:PAS domain S-box-containing protein